ncbi:hypothetical protein chiPu_0031079, partial [Chiloscyllium punctatum]|nr:hypothetical protein [Chiloscyllium punctatum]
MLVTARCANIGLVCQSQPGVSVSAGVLISARCVNVGTVCQSRSGVLISVRCACLGLVCQTDRCANLGL